MTSKELRYRLALIPDEMEVVVFAKGEIFDIHETQVFHCPVDDTDEDYELPVFELGCGWTERGYEFSE